MGELVVFGAFERSDLHHALLSGNEEQVITLLDQNKELVNQPLDWNEWTPLHVAVTTSIMNIVELLLRYNANPNASCAGGDTPLHLAALHGHLDVVVLLLQNGALVNVLNQVGFVHQQPTQIRDLNFSLVGRRCTGRQFTTDSVFSKF
eukprot:c15948_g1_i3.p1 GENE.c15948_g1_i3~~c15948_g1_i3.p1  ORF type:complete len:156 (+),score=31.65 c15948_g1_i3:26-469(+)